MATHRLLVITALLTAAATAAPAAATRCEVSAYASVHTPVAGAAVTVWSDQGLPSGQTSAIEAGAEVAGGPRVVYSRYEVQEPGEGLIEKATGVDVLGTACS